MFEFIDVIIAYTESCPEVRASIDVIEGETPFAFLYNVDLGVGVNVSTLDEVDKIDWKQIFTEQKADFIQDYHDKIAFLGKYEGDSVGD